MNIIIRSILTGLLATFAFILPLTQAHAYFMSGGGGDRYNSYQKDFYQKDFYQKDGFDGFCEYDRNCGDFKERYCSCDGGKCDHDNNVPEPTPLALLGLGLGVIGLVRRFVPSLRR